MLHTGHVMLVGEGAERFAVARGFPRENLLTDASRKGLAVVEGGAFRLVGAWHREPGLAQKARRAARTRMRAMPCAGASRDIAADLGIAPERREAAVHRVLFPPTGTTHCSTLSAKGDMSAAQRPAGLRGKFQGAWATRP